MKLNLFSKMIAKPYANSSNLDTIVTPVYGKQVLIGNWIERRYSLDQKTNAILPGIKTVDGCEKHISVTQASYPVSSVSRDEARSYIEEKRICSSANRTKGLTSNIIFDDDEKLKNNFTSSHTLAYDFLPKLQMEQQCNQPLGKPRIKKAPEVDLLDTFGNLTKTGHINYNRCVQNMEKNTRNKTIYHTSYTLPGGVKSKSIPFGSDYDGVFKMC